ncbi:MULTISPECIES: hypothetical protein [unclassified Sphingomonas]|uniref:hypothetical protein n=1 Tax=unclassified Sphingomonas TaxID=196159 RepID=UPI00226AD710|nr:MULTISPECIES: hypothetical protein [unclassified Sphingomonas]
MSTIPNPSVTPDVGLPAYAALPNDLPLLHYASTADGSAMRDLAEETSRRLITLRACGRLRRLTVVSRSEAPWESPGSKSRLDIKQIRKRLNAIRKQSPDSISQIVTAAGVSAIEGEAFGYCARIETLVLDLGEGQTSASAERTTPRTSIGSLVHQPPLEMHSTDDPDDDAIRTTVIRFYKAREYLRAASTEIAKTLKSHAFKEHRLARRLGTFQMDLLLPLPQAFLGAGAGETILKIALTAPVQRAKNAKKVEGSISREELIDLLWRDALANNRNAPPFVNL